MQSRAQADKSSTVMFKGKSIDTKNLRRYVKTVKRKEGGKEIALQPDVAKKSTDFENFLGHPPLSGNRIFMNWNLPYGPQGSSRANAADHVSPISDIMVTTPTSTHDAPSPTAATIRAMTAIDRARFFIEGRHIELLETMDSQQRVVMSTWMYQFWLFSFKTAKHWGRGPTIWTADILGLDEYQQQNLISVSSPINPASNSQSPAGGGTLMNTAMGVLPGDPAGKRPSDLCKWTIHVKEMDYEQIPTPPIDKTSHMDLEDEATWPVWDTFESSETITEKLSNGLETNDFSSIRQEDLPVAIPHIVRASKRSSEELDKEALGFAIMSRNLTLLRDLLKRISISVDCSGLYPYHLAMTYLDGAKTCCNILDELDGGVKVPLRKNYVNDLGHTVLDQLMMNILKAHTSCPPVTVDIAFKKKQRWEGEDVDICGRWDADSDCIRTLLANGTSAIPSEWKHMFCHTSVQAILHCIGAISDSSIQINTPSGLFIHHCSHCGLKLQSRPLHALIIVGTHLAQSGFHHENMFGILACLVSLLHSGANPLLKADLSLQTLMGGWEGNGCDHFEMDPLEMLEAVPTSLTSTWSDEIQIGWQIIGKVLRNALVGWQLLYTEESCSEYTAHTDHSEDSEGDIDGYGEGSGEENREFSALDKMKVDESRHTELPCCVDCEVTAIPEDSIRVFRRSKILAPLWAAIQTELLTYRRVEEGDAWISTNFDMAALNESLSHGGGVAVALVQNDMMKPFCRCGNFLESLPGCAFVDDATEPGLANFDIWSRTTYIGCPDRLFWLEW